MAPPRECFDSTPSTSGGLRYFLPPACPPRARANVRVLAPRRTARWGAAGISVYLGGPASCSDTDNDVVLEVNTLPGFTPTSILSKIAARDGLPELVERILASRRATKRVSWMRLVVAPAPTVPEPVAR